MHARIRSRWARVLSTGTDARVTRRHVCRLKSAIALAHDEQEAPRWSSFLTEGFLSLFRAKYSPDVRSINASSQETKAPALSFDEQYTMGRTIAQGSFGTVSEAVRTSDGRTKAVKVVPTAKMSVDREVKMIHKIHATAQQEQRSYCTNVIQVDSVFSDADNSRVVTELLSGGELLELMLERGCKFDEPESSRLILQILKSISACHRAGVVHLDIKPENFVFRSRCTYPASTSPGDTDSELVLIDFGSSQEANPAHTETPLARVFAGTLAYASPEVLDHRASLASDMWSAGVVAYILLTGQMPFKPHHLPDDFALLRNAQYAQDGDFAALSIQAQSFVRELICRDPSSRMTVDEAMGHDFIIKASSAASPALGHRGEPCIS